MNRARRGKQLKQRQKTAGIYSAPLRHSLSSSKGESVSWMREKSNFWRSSNASKGGVKSTKGPQRRVTYKRDPVRAEQTGVSEADRRKRSFCPE